MLRRLLVLSISISLYLNYAAVSFAQEADRKIGGCVGSLCQIGSTAKDGTGSIIGGVIQFIFVIAVILALGFLVFGGIKWLTSGGDKDGVASARGTIIAAIVGLVIIFLAYFILNFVLLFLTGAGFESIFIPQIINGSRAPNPTPTP